MNGSCQTAQQLTAAALSVEFEACAFVAAG